MSESFLEDLKCTRFHDLIEFTTTFRKVNPMHEETYCQKLLEKSLPNLHQKRKACLSRFLSSHLLPDTTLSVTSIGKRLKNNTTVKHKIKAADYFIGNKGMYKEQKNIYQGLSHYFWSGYQHLDVLVDWSGACGKDCFTLTASIVGSGRSVPLYQKVYSSKEQETQKAHNEFLHELKAVVPVDTHITIITDAGFHRDWFATVESLGWDFIGRIYSRYAYQPLGAESWHALTDLQWSKCGKACAIGEVLLGKTKQSLCCYLYQYREILSGKPHKKNLYPSHEKAYSDYYRKGWVIASSLNEPAAVIIRRYKKRMQIEQNFRDMKSEHYGIGLRRNKSQSLERVAMLLFFATLICIVLWWIGLMAERLQLHRHYQANTTRRRRVLSLVSLGALVVRHDPQRIKWVTLSKTVKQLKQQYQQFVETGAMA